jgi:hypothetical protein
MQNGVIVIFVVLGAVLVVFARQFALLSLRPYFQSSRLLNEPNLSIDACDRCHRDVRTGMNTKPESQRIFFCNRVSNLLVCALTGFGALYFLVETVEAVEETDASVVLVGFSALLMVAFLLVALREPFHGVVVTNSQVRIRNIMRTHVLGWDQIERFELAKYDPWPKIGVAILKTGRRVPMVGVQWAPLGQFAENTVMTLNRKLAATRALDTQNQPSFTS